MPLVTFQRNDGLGKIVIDDPPQNLFSGGLLSDLRDSANAAAASDVRAVQLRAGWPRGSALLLPDIYRTLSPRTGTTL